MTESKPFESSFSDWSERRTDTAKSITRGIRVPKLTEESWEALIGSLLHAILLRAQLTERVDPAHEHQPLFPAPTAIARAAAEFVWLWDQIQLDVLRQACPDTATPKAIEEAKKNVHATQRQALTWRDPQGNEHSTQDKFDLVFGEDTAFHWPLIADRLDHLVDTKGRQAAELANRALLWDNQRRDWLYPAAYLDEVLKPFITSYQQWYSESGDDDHRALTVRCVQFWKKPARGGRRADSEPPTLSGHTEIDGVIGAVKDKLAGFELKTGTSQLSKANRKAARRLASHWNKEVQILLFRWTEKECSLNWKGPFQPDKNLLKEYPDTREVTYRDDAWHQHWA